VKSNYIRVQRFLIPNGISLRQISSVPNVFPFICFHIQCLDPKLGCGVVVSISNLNAFDCLSSWKGHTDPQITGVRVWTSAPKITRLKCIAGCIYVLTAVLIGRIKRIPSTVTNLSSTVDVAVKFDFFQIPNGLAFPLFTIIKLSRSGKQSPTRR